AQFLFQKHSPVSSSTQYQLHRSPRSKPIVSLWLSTFLIACAVAVLIFFIAGLLYLLRFERVDNLGAYSIPSDTGLLIPSDCNSYRIESFATLTRSGLHHQPSDSDSADDPRLACFQS